VDDRDRRADDRAGPVAGEQLPDGDPHGRVRRSRLHVQDRVADVERTRRGYERGERRLLARVLVEEAAVPEAHGLVAEDEPDEHLHGPVLADDRQRLLEVGRLLARGYPPGLAGLRLEAV